MFLAKFGSFGTANGQFNGPYGVATDATGNVYVADSGNNRIQKFDSSGNFLFKWGTPGSGNSQFNSPTDVAVDGPGDVYVTDSFNYRVKRFDSSGAFLTAWGIPGQRSRPVQCPIWDRGGPDHRGRRIRLEQPPGPALHLRRARSCRRPARSVRPPGSSSSRPALARPPASVYVADSGNDRIERFQPSAVIEVRKDAVPDDPQDFDFTTGGGLSPSSFQLDDDGDPSNALSNSRVFPVDPGSGYSVSETVPAGWDLAAATCSDGSPPSNIDVSEGEDVTCTFTNNKRGADRRRPGHAARRPAGLRLHGRRRAQPDVVPARRRR